MAFPIDPARPPGIQPLENLVPDQGNVDPRAMLPLAPAREQQHHDVRQHAGLGHVQHDDDMNLEDMLPLRQAFNLDQDDAMLEDDNNQLREHRKGNSKRCHIAQLDVAGETESQFVAAPTFSGCHSGENLPFGLLVWLDLEKCWAVTLHGADAQFLCGFAPMFCGGDRGQCLPFVSKMFVSQTRGNAALFLICMAFFRCR